MTQTETNAHGQTPENSGVQTEELLDCFQTASAASSVIPAALEYGFFCGRASLALESAGHANNYSQQHNGRGGGGKFIELNPLLHENSVALKSSEGV